MEQIRQEDLLRVARAAKYSVKVVNCQVIFAYGEIFDPLHRAHLALQLAIDMGLNVIHHDSLCEVYCRYISCSEHYGTDPYAATRRAIVRAAIEKARRMEA